MGVLALAVAAVGSLIVTLDAGPARAGTPVPGAAGCPMFPSDNIWNTDISSLPVDVHSAQWLASMDSCLDASCIPTSGPRVIRRTPYGMPYTVVPPGHPFVHVTFQYASESDPGPVSLRRRHPHRRGPERHR